MHFRSPSRTGSLRPVLPIALLAAATLLGSCTTRYQDLLRSRDADIRELSGRVAALRAENEDLERQLAQERTRPQEPATPEPAAFRPTEALQNELGAEADISYRNGRLSIGVQDSVTFDSGSDQVKSTAHGILKKIAAVLTRDFADARYYVEGHTDTDPIAKTKDRFQTNHHLSLMRAHAVARYLVSQGVPESKIVVVGYGQYEPVDPRSKERNRRVEIVPARQ